MKWFQLYSSLINIFVNTLYNNGWYSWFSHHRNRTNRPTLLVSCISNETTSFKILCINIVIFLYYFNTIIFIFRTLRIDFNTLQFFIWQQFSNYFYIFMAARSRIASHRLKLRSWNIVPQVNLRSLATETLLFIG